MKHLKPPRTGPSPASAARLKRRATLRFSFSAIIASFVVLGLLILGAMFQDDYEKGFVRIVSFAVRLATPEEVAQAEAQGPIPEPLPGIRPDSPIVVNSDRWWDPVELSDSEALLPAPEILIPIEGIAVETAEGLELLNPSETLSQSQDTQEEEGAETE